MRILRRILVTVVVTLAVIYVGINWIAPASLSIYAVRKALPVAKVVPTDLKDKSISDAPGTKLSYFGYEFEVPWSDLEETQTTLYPKNKPEKTRVVLAFRSGLRVMVNSIPAHEWTTGATAETKWIPRVVEATFGPEAIQSDYNVERAILEFTPDKMHYWALSSRVYYREQMLLLAKSVMPSAGAETGIFNLENPSFKGFQQGDPKALPGRPWLRLFSDTGGVEFALFRKDYRTTAGVTQPELNRIVQSLRKAPDVTTPALASK